MGGTPRRLPAASSSVTTNCEYLRPVESDEEEEEAAGGYDEEKSDRESLSVSPCAEKESRLEEKGEARRPDSRPFIDDVITAPRILGLRRSLSPSSSHSSSAESTSRTSIRSCKGSLLSGLLSSSASCVGVSRPNRSRAMASALRVRSSRARR
jgi:hypothetical protein